MNCVTQSPSMSGQYDNYLEYLEGFGMFKKDIFNGHQGGGYIIEDRHVYHYFFKIGVDTFGSPLNLKVLSVDDIPESDKLYIYPNPSSSWIYINNQNRNEEILFFNSLGQLLITTTENKIDLSKYPVGVYYLRCGRVVQKVIHL